MLESRVLKHGKHFSDTEQTLLDSLSFSPSNQKLPEQSIEALSVSAS